MDDADVRSRGRLFSGLTAGFRIGDPLGKSAAQPGAFVVFVDFEVRSLSVVCCQHIRSAAYLWVAVVSLFGIQYGLLQQFRRVDGLRLRRVFVADVDPVSVSVSRVQLRSGIYLASRCDFPDRIRYAQQQSRLEEVWQELVVQRDGQLVVVDHAHAAQPLLRSGNVVRRAFDVLRPVDFSADLLNLGRHHQQQGKRVVPGGNGAPVGIVQVIVQCQEIDFISFPAFHDHEILHHGLVDNIYPLALVPVHQVVSVNQRAYVNVRRIVSEHFREEVTLHHGGMAYLQFFRIRDRFFRRGSPG